MILAVISEFILIGIFALVLDFVLGDPKNNRYHPTAWMGSLIAALTGILKHPNPSREKAGGILLVLCTITTVLMILGTLYLVLWFGLSTFFAFDPTITNRDTAASPTTHDIFFIGFFSSIIIVVIGTILLKSTIAVRGMAQHAFAVMTALDQDNMDTARAGLAKIVKRDTASLDRNHVVSGVLESVSENTVDGVTGPLFYYALFVAIAAAAAAFGGGGLVLTNNDDTFIKILYYPLFGVAGAFMYRVVNTADSMIGYKTPMFRNIGWFTALCDTILNYIPSRLTGLIMVVSAALLSKNWRNCCTVMIRDGRKTPSRNAGYPMAALAGALDIKFEKINHYRLGDNNHDPTTSVPFTNNALDTHHIKSAVSMLKLSCILFFVIVVIPISFITLYTVSWFLHA